MHGVNTDIIQYTTRTRIVSNQCIYLQWSHILFKQMKQFTITSLRSAKIWEASVILFLLHFDNLLSRTRFSAVWLYRLLKKKGHVVCCLRALHQAQVLLVFGYMVVSIKLKNNFMSALFDQRVSNIINRRP